MWSRRKDVLQERDIERTVGINTGHVDTSDFVLEDADRDFLVEVSGQRPHCRGEWTATSLQR